MIMARISSRSKKYNPSIKGDNASSFFSSSPIVRFFSFRPAIVFLIFLALLVVLFYGSTLRNDFILDDRKVIQENEYIHSWQYFPKIFTGCIWEYTHGGCAGKTLHYRPFHSFSNFLVWQAAPNSPAAFHTVNLVYFLGTGALTFLLGRRLSGSFVFGAMSSLIVFIHPVQSEAVNWISAVSELTPVLFILLFFLLYARWRASQKVPHLAGVLAVFWLALISKETAFFILPPLIFAYDFLIGRDAGAAHTNLKSTVRGAQETLAAAIRRYAYFAIPAGIYLAMRMQVLGGLGGLTNTQNYLGGFSLPERAGIFFRLFGYALREIVYPKELTFFHDAIKPSANFFDAHTLIAVGLFAAFWIVFALLVWRGKRVAAFGLAWFAISFLPVMVFFRIAGSENFFFERYLLGPSVGLAFFVSALLAPLWERAELFATKIRARTVRIHLFGPLTFYIAHKTFQKATGALNIIFAQRNRRIAIAIIFLVFAAGSWRMITPRNTDWKDNKTLVEATLRMSPHAVSFREFLADELIRVHNDDEGGLREYRYIVEHHPDAPQAAIAYVNLGDWERKKNKDTEKAKEYYKKGVAVVGGLLKAKGAMHHSLGEILLEENNYTGSLPHFCRAFQESPDNPKIVEDYQKILGMFEGLDDYSFLFAYVGITQGGAFTASTEDKITYERKSCAYGTCNYFFTTRLTTKDILFPFLIFADAFPGEVARPKDLQFDSTTGRIVLVMDEAYKDRMLTFKFPSCDATMYVVEVAPLFSGVQPTLPPGFGEPGPEQTTPADEVQEDTE